MESIIIGIILSFILTFYSIPAIISIASMKKLYDYPDERKVHANPIPSLGGVGIFGGFLLGLLIAADINSVIQHFQFLIAAFIIVFFLGVKDDILIITPLKKFIGQVVVGLLLMFKAGVLIQNMYGFLSITTIEPTLSFFLTLFTIIVITNAFNLIDGIDGLAAMLSIISLSVFGIFFYLNHDMFYALLAFCFVASLLAFLIYNFHPAKIFMGDTGSTLSGLLNAILVIHFINTAENSTLLPHLSSPAMGFGILLIPMLDTLRVFGIRMLHGRSPFSPDRNHLHHILLDRGLSHKTITLTLSAFALLFILLSYFTLPLGTTKVILIQTVLFFIGIYILHITKPKSMQLYAVGNEEENAISTTSFVNRISQSLFAKNEKQAENN
ncbi:MAG: undecaprenyl/decaprenyl-phosphate alpha-N-acetylglucosaminyl 1-phosphate transferase [Bacteroidetes bacterium]|nr:undecaprenyl/decaprenyl-phosphate alpha-N-acetylglucosaminyl 1-phosphate transferase [Bacteroidota bacterium]